MPPDFPWYSVVEGDVLEQGDMLKAFPVLVPSVQILSSSGAPEIEADVEHFNVIVMTQSCDLASDKIDQILLCAHIDFDKAKEVDERLSGKSRAEEVQKGRYLRYQLLAPSVTEVTMPLQLIDFGRVFSMPKELVLVHARNQGKRLRLLPPYREHIAQSFAMCYMRVGVPIRPLDLPGLPSPDLVAPRAVQRRSPQNS